jgi:hypothetical protein
MRSSVFWRSTRSPLFDDGRRETPPLETQGDVLAHGHGIKEGGELEHISDLRPEVRQPVTVQQVYDLAVHFDLTGVRLEQSHSMLQGDALTRAGVPHEHHGLPFRHLERESLQYVLRSKALGQVSEQDHRVNHSHSVSQKYDRPESIQY